jgi:hypothetical protein
MRLDVVAAFVVDIPTGCGFAVELFRGGIVEFESGETGKFVCLGGLVIETTVFKFQLNLYPGRCDQQT